MDNKDLTHFLNYLLHNKNLTKAQVKRRDYLISKDYSFKSSEIEFRYVSPKLLRKLLFRFNQNDVLKYACHEIDSDDVIADICNKCNTVIYDFSKHRKLMSDEFQKLLDSFRKRGEYLDNKMVALIQCYINGTGPWSKGKIKMNWQNTALLSWSKDNPGKIPSPGYNIAKKQESNGFNLPDSLKFRSHLTGTRVQTFRDLVVCFKSLFHIRRDNSLRHIIEFTNTRLKNKDKLKISFDNVRFRDNIEILTNVDKLIETYEKILDICIEAHNTKNDFPLNIELSFYDEEDSTFFCIHDKDSVYAKNLRATRQRIGQQQTHLIKNQINGLCDLYLEADFGNNEYARVALWNENSSSDFGNPKMDVENIEGVTGVKYLLKFY